MSQGGAKPYPAVDNNNQKWCVITGGSSGLGKELAALAAKNSYDLINISRSPLALDNSHDLTDTCIKNVCTDLSTKDGLACAISFLENHKGSIRLYINCAGSMCTGKAGSHDQIELESYLHLAVISPTAICGILAKQAHESICMLNISSMCSVTTGYGTASNSIYSSAKRYTDFLFDCMGDEFHRQGRAIYVSNAHPGPLETALDKTWNRNPKGLFEVFFYNRLSTSLAARKIWQACVVNRKKRFIRKTDYLKLLAWRMKRTVVSAVSLIRLRQTAQPLQ